MSIRARVKHWNSDREYGFAVPLDGTPDVIVHWTVIVSGDSLRRGDLIDIEYEETNRGLRATRAELVARG